MLDRGGGDREASGFRIASCSTLAIVTTCGTGCWTSRRLTRGSSPGLWLARSHTTKETGGRISTSCSPSQTRCLCPRCWKPGPRPSFASSGQFSYSTFRAARSSTECSCSRTAWSLICRLRQHPSFARGAPSFGSSSGKLSRSRRNRRPPRMSCLGTPSTTRSMPESPSNEVGIGRRSIGSARYATTHSPSLVASGDSMAGTAGTSTDCLRTSWFLSTKHSCARLNPMNSIAHLGVPLPHFFVNPLRSEKWQSRWRSNCADWHRDTSASLG